MRWLWDVGTLLAAGALGPAVVARWIARTRRRRQARTELLAAISEAERVFYAEDPLARGAAVDEVSRVAHDAGAPRVLVDLYEQGAHLTQRLFDQGWDAGRGDEPRAVQHVRSGHNRSVRAIGCWLRRPWVFRLERRSLVRATKSRYQDAQTFLMRPTAEG